VKRNRGGHLKAFAEYDEGRLTKAGFSEVVERTIEKLYNDRTTTASTASTTMRRSNSTTRSIEGEPARTMTRRDCDQAGDGADSRAGEVQDLTFHVEEPSTSPTRRRHHKLTFYMQFRFPTRPRDGRRRDAARAEWISRVHDKSEVVTTAFKPVVTARSTRQEKFRYRGSHDFAALRRGRADEVARRVEVRADPQSWRRTDAPALVGESNPYSGKPHLAPLPVPRALGGRAPPALLGMSTFTT